MRPPFEKRPFLLKSEDVRERIIALVRNLPVDADKPLQVIVQEYKEPRKLDQQALLFAGPMKDIAEQAWIGGRQYSVEVLHEYLKRELLPNAFDPELCLDGYVKWSSDPSGNPVMVGSTKKLTKKGYSAYLEGVFAFGAALGVVFHANPNEGMNR